MTPPHLILMLTSELFKTTSRPKHSNEPYHLQTPQKGATIENQSNLNKTLSQKLRFYNQTWPLAQGFMLGSFHLAWLVWFSLIWLGCFGLSASVCGGLVNLALCVVFRPVVYVVRCWLVAL